MRAGPAALVLFLALAGNDVRAQGASEQVKALAGAYELSNSERDKTCALTLKTDPARGGFKLEAEKGCEAIPAVREIESWALVNDALRFLDARGRTLFDFTEVESGMFEAERRGEGLYFLQNAAAAPPPPKTAEQMAGEWTIRRNAGQAICTLTLRTANASDEGLQLQVRPGCDPLVTRFAPGSWKMELDQLVLNGRNGETWRFEQDDENASLWKRLSESAERVTMVKK